MAAISLRGITKNYARQSVLKNVSLDVEEGEFLTLMGPSGCGKSTLLRIIAGLESQESGNVLIGGVQVDDHSPKMRDIAMVFQSYALYPHMSAAQNISLPLKMRRLTRWQRMPLMGGLLPGTRRISAQIEQDVQSVAKMLDISDLLDRKPSQLSGGQRQRVALGRAMVRHPRVFLMDEPLANLDGKNRVRMRREIVSLQRRLGATFVYVTHDQSEAMTMSDRVAVIIDGEVLQVGTPRQLYANPEDLRVAELIGMPKVNCLRARVTRGGEIEIAGISLPIYSGFEEGTELVIGLRPESLALAEDTLVNALSGFITEVEHTGSDAFIYVASEGLVEPVAIRLNPERALSLQVGVEIRYRLVLEDVMVFDSSGRRVQSIHTRLTRHTTVGNFVTS